VEENWFVYAKRPFAGPEPVLAYLARYTHRVAISNSRLLALDERGVTFRYKDYRRNGRARYRTMTLAPDKFIRRFLLHILPKGFHRIRHYGLLASAAYKTNIARARELIAIPVPLIDPPADDEADLTANADHRPPCPCCGGRMIIVETFERAGAPRARHHPMSGSELRRHDHRHHPITSSARRGRLLPALHRRRPDAPSADCILLIMPKSPRRRPRRQKGLDRDRRFAADLAGQHYPRRDGRHIKSP
jgi:hypothetical protein